MFSELEVVVHALPVILALWEAEAENDLVRSCLKKKGKRIGNVVQFEGPS